MNSDSESNAKALERAGLADGPDERLAHGYVLATGRQRALAGMTTTAPERADLERWVGRLGDLEPEAKPAALQAAAQRALTLMNELAAAAASSEANSLVDCIETWALQDVRLYTEATAAPAYAVGPPAFSPGYEDLMATARLRDLAQRRVAELRCDLFGSARVPFKTMTEAVAWIEAERAAAGEHTPEEIERFAAAYNQIGAQLAQLQWRGSPFADDYTHPRARFVALDSGAGVRLYAVGKSAPLKQLYYGLKGLADDLRIDDWQAAYFVVLGVPPAVPRYSMVASDRLVFDAGEPPREFVSVPFIELEINDRFFSYEDIRAVFRDLAASGFLLSRKSPAQLAKLRRLQEFISGRRPREKWRDGGRRRALPWKQVRRAWNLANPTETYSLSGIQKAYKEAGDYLAGRATTASSKRGQKRKPGLGGDQPPQST